MKLCDAFALMLLVACSTAKESAIDQYLNGGIEGANCAGAAPEMTTTTGDVLLVQEMDALFWEELDAYFDDVGTPTTRRVLQLSLPSWIEGEAFFKWLAKAGQILMLEGEP